MLHHSAFSLDTGQRSIESVGAAWITRFANERGTSSTQARPHLLGAIDPLGGPAMVHLQSEVYYFGLGG
jgi:hypothetical protein